MTKVDARSGLAPRARRERPPLARALVAAALVLALLAAWRLGPLDAWAAPERLAAWAAFLRAEPFGPAAAAAGVAVASTLLVPITALIVAAALVFGWQLGALVAFAGALGSALLGWALGKALWRDAVRRLAGRRAREISQALARRGVLSVAVLRVVPVAPFGVVNLVAGVSHVGLRDYLIGTAIGMAPGTLAIAFFAHGTLRAVTDPGVGTLALAAGTALLLVASVRWLRAALRARAGA